ncbi:MAG: ATP-binding cassette domain-containing protein [Anaeroplasma sp.]
MEYVLRTYDIVKSYNGHRVLDELSINICKGDIYGFVGENGSGKTTIIRIVTGLIFPNRGGYELFGVDHKSKDILDQRRKVSAIVESPSIYNNLSARDNLLMQASIFGIDINNRVDDILIDVGLGDVVNDKKKAKNFSLGMKQRLGIAMCLVLEPEFLILDEPMNGLDPAGIVELRELIIKLNQEKNITFLISSHILSELSLVANKFGFISKGKLIKEISKEDLDKELADRIIISTDNPEKALEVLSTISSNLKLLDNKVVVYDEIEVNDAMKLLVDNQISILGINCEKTSIEDYYLNLIGGKRHA